MSLATLTARKATMKRHNMNIRRGFSYCFSLEEGFILCLIGFQIYPAQIAAAFLQNLLQSLIGQFFLTQDVHHECHVDAADQTRVRLLEIWIH